MKFIYAFYTPAAYMLTIILHNIYGNFVCETKFFLTSNHWETKLSLSLWDSLWLCGVTFSPGSEFSDFRAIWIWDVWIRDAQPEPETEVKESQGYVSMG